jgi:hypothetical protein
MGVLLCVATAASSLTSPSTTRHRACSKRHVIAAPMPGPTPSATAVAPSRPQLDSDTDDCMAAAS